MMAKTKKHVVPGNQRLSVIPVRAVADPELSDGAFRTLAALGAFGDRNGWCYPSYATLATIRGVSKSAIAKHIAELVERGYLNIQHRYDNNGAQQSNLLQIRFDYDFKPEPETESETATSPGSDRPGEESPPRFPGGNPPYTSEVNGGYTSEVNPPYTLKGERLTPHINVNTSSSGAARVEIYNDPAAETGGDDQQSPALLPPVLDAEASLARAERLYQMVRPGHLIIPRTRWYEDALRVLNQVLDRHGGDYQAAAAELRAYAAEADRRNIAPTNLCWLVEWAATGGVPQHPAERRSAAAARKRASATAARPGEPKPREISEAEAERLRAIFAQHAQEVAARRKAQVTP